MRIFTACLSLILLCGAAEAQKTISFPTEDGGTIFADVYGSGEKAVVLAHRGRFNKESWQKQAPVLVDAGFQVLALDFRGRGKSRGPDDTDLMSSRLYLDVLGAVQYLRQAGVKSVSVVGASLGGGAAGDASIKGPADEIDRVVFLGSAPNEPADKLKSRSLFIVARDDANADGPRLPGIRAQFERAPEPKELIVVDGSAHAQFLFETDQGERVMREIVHFLTAK